MGYVILENDDALHLTAEVRRRMAQGWKPLGRVSCYYDTRNEAVRYVQTLVREPVETGATPPPTA
ncbi:DUF1737 domain-containing protein [Gemmata sp. JC717]|uniref:DUF1737 domain-containing protein n=1 Tax=Gemmata algarum TaxID=2975278 RepID=UPI0021BA73E0|nr:DUF1737 domain-containing protein [Gemmata algarum]MDY3551222.1 DUF1737 domain-containing protein [Gemmata algarum]